jgi:hypothetical protein
MGGFVPLPAGQTKVSGFAERLAGAMAAARMILGAAKDYLSWQDRVAVTVCDGEGNCAAVGMDWTTPPQSAPLAGPYSGGCWQSDTYSAGLCYPMTPGGLADYVGYTGALEYRWSGCSGCRSEGFYWPDPLSRCYSGNSYEYLSGASCGDPIDYGTSECSNFDASGKIRVGFWSFYTKLLADCPSGVRTIKNEVVFAYRPAASTYDVVPSTAGVDWGEYLDGWDDAKALLEAAIAQSSGVMNGAHGGLADPRNDGWPDEETQDVPPYDPEFSAMRSEMEEVYLELISGVELNPYTDFVVDAVAGGGTVGGTVAEYPAALPAPPVSDGHVIVDNTVSVEVENWPTPAQPTAPPALLYERQHYLDVMMVEYFETSESSSTASALFDWASVNWPDAANRLPEACLPELTFIGGHTIAPMCVDPYDFGAGVLVSIIQWFVIFLGLWQGFNIALR